MADGMTDVEFEISLRETLATGRAIHPDAVARLLALLDEARVTIANLRSEAHAATAAAMTPAQEARLRRVIGEVRRYSVPMGASVDYTTARTLPDPSPLIEQAIQTLDATASRFHTENGWAKVHPR